MILTTSFKGNDNERTDPYNPSTRLVFLYPYLLGGPLYTICCNRHLLCNDSRGSNTKNRVIGKVLVHLSYACALLMIRLSLTLYLHFSQRMKSRIIANKSIFSILGIPSTPLIYLAVLVLSLPGSSQVWY